LGLALLIASRLAVQPKRNPLHCADGSSIGSAVTLTVAT
jgi:hypothetical protein